MLDNKTIVRNDQHDSRCSKVTTVLANPPSGTIVMTLPAAAASPGYKVVVKNISANAVTVAVNSGDDLEGTLNGTVAVSPGSAS